MQEIEITRIEPGSSRVAPELRDIWRHRELLYFLTWRDVKIRYKQTAIGIFWAVLQPVLTTAIFTVIFSRFAKFDTSDVPYPLFALSGLTVWLFVHTSVTTASASFVSNTNLVTKVYFPRLIVPLASVLAALFDLIFSFAVVVLMMVYYRTYPGTNVLLVPVFIFLSLVLASSFGILFSALNVRFRDVKFALPFLLQVWMIASPIFYPLSLLSDNWKLLFAVNPLTGILEGLRSSFFGTAFDWQVIGISCGSLAVILVVSLAVFKWMEDDFADLI
ncbi:MAG TPA: ABC transporter permease [Pyrinomonadaceae bacterium]|nr:ABC transporter permease [Pyrinomonadaceae bacterium]